MKSLAFILFLFLSVGLSAQSGSASLCRWHVSDKVLPSDYQFIKKAKLYYYLSNDYDNIYIDFKIEDPGVQRMILEEGLTIWINMDGKSAKKMGVRYPMGSQNKVGRNQNTRSENETNSSQQFDNPVLLANTIELIGFINEEVRHFSSENADNFRGSVKFDGQRILYYKMVMPITKLPVRNSKDGRSAMPFAIGIEFGYTPEMSKSEKNPGPPSSSSSKTGLHQSGTTELYWIKDITLASSK
jgi:hypothetical protein